MRMEKKSELLNVQELKSGMLVLKDVMQNGKLLIKEGTFLTDDIIDRLKNVYFLEKIQVNLSEELLIQHTREEEIKKVESTFREVSERLEEVFNNAIEFKKNGMDEMRKFSQKIQNEINSTAIVVSNIVFKGSGTDCIYRHGVNVAALSALLGKWIGLEKNQINLLIYSALLHDFGMTKVDKKIIEKPRRLVEEEFKIIKEHSKIGYKYISEIPYLDKSVSYGVLMHHERADGSGYPLKITGEKIHPFAKIIAIADVFDALNSDRIYRKKKGSLEALEIIKEESLNKLDYEYSKIFLGHISNYYMGEEVRLSNGETAKILQIDQNNLSRPLLLKDGEFIDLNIEKDLNVEELILN